MPDLTVFVDGVDHSKLVDRDNRISFGRDINGQGQARFVLADTPDGFVPTDGMEVLIKEDGVDRYGGIVNGRPRNFRGPDSSKQLTFYQVDVASWEQRLNKRRIWRTYTATTFEDIVSDINTNFLDSEGITLSVLAGSVQTITFNGETVAEALDTLCSLEGDGRSWYITPAKVLTINLQDATPAPATLNATNIELNNPAPTVAPDRTGYANTITVVGGNPELPILFTARDTTEIAARAAIEGGSGIYHDAIEDSEIVSAGQAEVKAEGILLQRKQIRQRFTALTRISGFDIGQQVTVNLPNLGIDEVTYFIISIQTVASPGSREFWHTITAVDGFIDGSWQSEYRRKLPPKTIPMQVEATPGLVRVLPTPGVLIHDPVEGPGEWFQGAVSSSLTGGVSSVALAITHEAAGQGGFIVSAGRGPVAIPRKSHLELYPIDANNKSAASPTKIFTWDEKNASSFRRSIIVSPDNTKACLMERDGAAPHFIVVSLVDGSIGSTTFAGMADANTPTEGCWVGDYVYWPEASSGSGSIFVFDVSDPSAPFLDNEFATGLTSIESCVPSSDGLFLYATGSGALAIKSIDISDPTAPVVDTTLVITGDYQSLDIDEDDARLFMVSRSDASNVQFALIDVSGGTITLDTETTLALSTSKMEGVACCFFKDSAVVFQERPASTTPNTQKAHVFSIDPVAGVTFVETFAYPNDTSSNRGPIHSFIGNRAVMKHDGVTAEHQVTYGQPSFDAIVPYEIEKPLRTSFGGTGIDGETFRKGDLLVGSGPGALARLLTSTLDGSYLRTRTTEETGTVWECDLNLTQAAIDDTDSPYDLPLGVTVVLADATLGAITINLPPVASNVERLAIIKNVGDGSNAVTVDGDGIEKIGGDLTRTLSAEDETLGIVGAASTWEPIFETAEVVPTPAAPILTIPLLIGNAELLEANVPAFLTSAAGWPRVLAFDDAIEEFASWSLVLPSNYDGSPMLKGVFRAAAATGEFGITAAIMATGDGDPTAADSYDAGNDVSITVPGTIANQGTFAISLVNFDSAALGDKLVLLLSRDTAVASNAVGDIEVGDVWLEYVEGVASTGSIARNVQGLFDSDDFNRADGAHGPKWTTHRGVPPVISSNELKGTPTGTDITATLNSGLLDTMFVQSFVRSGDVSVPAAIIGKWVDATGGYMMQISDFQNLLRIFRWNGSGFTFVASSALAISTNDEWDAQLYLADNVQDGWVQKRTGGVIQTVSATDGNVLATGESGVNSGTGISTSCEWDNFMMMRTKDIIVDGLPAGYKAKVKDSGGSVVAEATESSGTATIDASMAGGASEVVPFVGWAEVIVTDAAGLQKATFDTAGVYPGDTFTFTA
jgi:hypothetical protein